VIEGLMSRFESDADDPVITDTAELLLASALVAEGSDVPDPARFNSLMAGMLERGL
jgi:molecular chaperone HtpG